jgi:hypothetical protein
VPLRSFKDESGREWEVWEVAAAHKPARRTLLPGLAVPAPLKAGWLAFQSGRDRRRLVPVPPGWTDLSMEGLRDLLGRARVIAAARRLIE